MVNSFVSALICGAFFLGSLLFPTLAHASERASTNRPTEMREGPSADTKRLAPLLANAEVTVLARQLAWVRVEAAGQQGWIPADHVQSRLAFKDTPSVAKSNFLGWFTAVLRIGGSRASQGSSAVNRTSTATIGIRGLGLDGANAAKFSSDELQKLKLYSVSRSDAEDFAATAALVPSSAAYIN